MDWVPSPAPQWAVTAYPKGGAHFLTERHELWCWVVCKGLSQGALLGVGCCEAEAGTENRYASYLHVCRFESPRRVGVAPVTLR
jgi:hypothetical protein